MLTDLSIIGHHASSGSSGILSQSVSGGLIGGGTVLLGVLVAEYLAHRREQTGKFQSEFWNLIAMWNDTFGWPTPERARASGLIVAQLGRLFGASTPPQRKWRAKAKEVSAVAGRYQAAAKKWRENGTIPEANLVIGKKLEELAYFVPRRTRIATWVRKVLHLPGG